MMDLDPSQQVSEVSVDLPWYVYDGHVNLLRIAATLADAEAWAAEHWRVVEVAGREEVDEHDYWYLLLASPDESSYRARDHQARILRHDRVTAIGGDPKATPRYP